MELFEAIGKRASVRAFAPCDVPDDDLVRIVDAGRRAPSGRNRQPWEFIIVSDADVIARLGEIQGCIGQASAAVAIVMDDQASEYWKEDAAAAIENMLLAITALGYASVWVEGYVLHHEDYGKEVLGVPENRRLLAVLPIGKPEGEAVQAQKKPLDEVLHRNRYGSKDTA
jgi:nitroreductase